jgi:hypothetical protein
VPRRLSPLAVASPMHPVAEIKNLRSGMLPCRATFLQPVIDDNESG